MPQPPGTRFGPYEIVGTAGAGGMGEVYKARDTRLDRVVALKVLPSHLADDPTARARFDREARAIAALNHPNVCALFDVGHDQGRDFLVLELLEGQTLADRLAIGPVEIPKFLEIAQAIADALEAAHGRGLIHRDLKPANIFLTSRGVPKILDFGLAKATDAVDDATRQTEASLTQHGATIGTVAYMSPEQLRAEPLDARTDLFSLGLVFYEMVTGQRAFSGATSAVVAAGILARPVTPPRTLRADLPQPIENMLLKLLEKDRALRCQSATDLRADLRRAATGSAPDVTVVAMATAPATATQEQTLLIPGRQQPRTSRGYGLVAAAAVLLIGVVSAGYWWTHRVPEPPVPPTLPPAVSTSAVTSPPAAGSPTNSVPPPPPAPVPDPKPPAQTKPVAKDTAASAAPVAPGVVAVTPPPAGDVTGLAPGTGGRGRIGGARGLLLGPAGANLSATLKTLPPLAYHIVFAPTLEAETFARQLRVVLDGGGWRCSGIRKDVEPPVPFVMGVPAVTESATMLLNWARRNGLAPEVHVVPRLQEVQIVIGTRTPKRGGL